MAVLEVFASSVYQAIHRDLPLVDYRTEDWDAWKRLSKAEQSARKSKIAKGHAMMPMKVKQREPLLTDVKFTLFQQTWPSRSLGFAFKSDAVPTDAYTVVAEGESVCAVYFNGRLAYLVNVLQDGLPRKDIFWKKFQSDVDGKALCSCDEAARAYKAHGVNRYGNSVPGGQVQTSVEEFDED